MSVSGFTQPLAELGSIVPACLGPREGRDFLCHHLVMLLKSQITISAIFMFLLLVCLVMKSVSLPFY